MVEFIHVETSLSRVAGAELLFASRLKSSDFNREI